ncbi:MAG: protein phosphatase 2C domain-containing protein [Candidatus Competibacteraceae bacterium]|nr:protein phosphatase 2C domain-containing protein [Candidatus Competibacteraceae bacterium]
MQSIRLSWISASRTHVGMVRKINEDACLELPERGLWAVADGMGGHEAGDLASRRIVETLAALPHGVALPARLDHIHRAIAEVNQELREEAARRFGGGGTIGSTLVALLAQPDGQAACLWAGDSRLYRYCHNRLERVSRDHSHVQELVDRGLLPPDQAEHHPLSNVITRAVGAEGELELEQRLLTLENGELFLLCSDGLTKTLDEGEIAALLSHGNPREAVQTLIHTALVRQADDNVTVVVVQVEAEEETRTFPNQERS